MKPKTKKFVTVGFVLSAVSIWIPQLFMGVVEPRSDERPELSHDETAFMAGDAGAPVEPQPGKARKPVLESTTQPGVRAKETPATLPAGASINASLEQVATRLGSAMPQTERVALSELLSALRPVESQAKPGVKEQSRVSSVEGLELRGSQDRMRLEEYCAQLSLNAVICGKAGAVAMLDGRCVRVGDSLGSGIEVKAIGSRTLTLGLGEQSQQVGLPAFKASGVGASQAALEPQEVPIPSATSAGAGAQGTTLPSTSAGL